MAAHAPEKGRWLEMQIQIDHLTGGIYRWPTSRCFTRREMRTGGWSASSRMLPAPRWWGEWAHAMHGGSLTRASQPAYVSALRVEEFGYRGTLPGRELPHGNRRLAEIE